MKPDRESESEEESEQWKTDHSADDVKKLKYHDITIFLGFPPEGEGGGGKPPRSPR